MLPTWPPAPGTKPAATATYQYSTNPQYTAVQARQSFANTLVAQPPPGSTFSVASAYGTPSPVQMANTTSTPMPNAAADNEAPKKKIDWPDSVRNYVQRSFMSDNMDPSVSRAEMEAKLKDTISQANDAGVMYTFNWDTMPLPQQLIKEEREQMRQALMSQNNTNYPGQSNTPHSSTGSRKRKSGDLGTADDANNMPPWRASQSPGNALELRLAKGLKADDSKQTSKYQKQLEKRQKRFNGGYKSTYRSPTPPPTDGPVVGTCQNLEKRYLRLTAPPVASMVRPEHILHQTLELLKKKWKRESNYSYICDQFKSMRQDLTVQRIKNNFTVQVYEIHARIALEKGDLGEYNQCQTQLKALYQMGLKGNPMEFKAYRILYFIHTANRSALNDALADLTTAEKADHAIKHALAVRSALALGNYHRFFQLYLDTPNMGAYLMDMFVERERLAAICKIGKAYKHDVRLRFVTEELGFESDADAAQFIVNFEGQQLLEQRGDDIVFLAAKAGPLFEAARSKAFARIDIKGQI